MKKKKRKKQQKIKQNRKKQRKTCQDSPKKGLCIPKGAFFKNSFTSWTMTKTVISSICIHNQQGSPKAFFELGALSPRDEYWLSNQNKDGGHKMRT